MNKSTKEDTDKRPDWLQRVQEQSWEPEILISGIVLFALLQIPPYLESFAHYLENYSFAIFSSGNTDDSLIAVLLTANYWLIAGFTSHLVFRSVWAAFIGLSYVYPQGVRQNQLKFKPAYRKILSKSSDYQDSILKLERICSTVFAVSFLLFMTVIGSFFFLTIVATIIGVLFEYFPETMKANQGLIDPILSTICLIYLFDFVTLGLLKRIPVVSKIYYPFYRVMSFLTLAPLYRNIYYGFVSNHQGWKVGLWMLVFSSFSIVMVFSVRNDVEPLNTMELQINNTNYTMYHGHYDNLMGNSPSQRMHIQSDMIEDPVLRVFIVHSSGWEEWGAFKVCDYEKKKDEPGINLDSLKLDCLRKFYQLKLNGEAVSPDFLFHEKQRTNQAGLLGYVDISDLPRGQHFLELAYLFENGPRQVAKVEFYKISPAISDQENKDQSLN